MVPLAQRPGRDRAWSAAPSGSGGIAIAAESENVDLGERDAYVLLLSGDGELVWDTRVNTPGDQRVYSIARSADGAFVVTNNNAREEPYLRVWESATGDRVTDLDDFVGLSVEFSGDGGQLVLGEEDGTITVFDFLALRNGVPATDPAAIVRRIPAHGNPINTVRISPDGSLVASGALDEAAKLWDLETGQALGEFGTTAQKAIAFDPVHPWLYVSEGGQVSVYTLDLDELIAIARDRLTRAMPDDECTLYLRRACDD